MQWMANSRFDGSFKTRWFIQDSMGYSRFDGLFKIRWVNSRFEGSFKTRWFIRFRVDPSPIAELLRSLPRRRSWQGLGCELCQSSEFVANGPSTDRSTARANRMSHFQKPARPRSRIVDSDSSGSQNVKTTRAVLAQAAQSGHPNDWRLPNRGAANNPIRHGATFSRRRESQVAGPATILPQSPRRFVPRHPYCQESRADAKRYSESEMVKSKTGFPVRMNCYTVAGKINLCQYDGHPRYRRSASSSIKDQAQPW